MENVAGWIAPIATMIAAMMTAANLGARVTGWGFVVFTVGSICWLTVAIGTKQTNLLVTNGFLTLVNVVGIWRWLGRQRAYEDGGRSAEAASRRSASPTLFTATGIAAMSVEDKNGGALGKAVEALIECQTGSVSYVVVATGGVGGVDETLRAIARNALIFGFDRLVVTMDKSAFESLPTLVAGNWPASA